MMLTRPPRATALPRRPWVLWLALGLALFGALAPTVSHALQWARGGATAGLIEICTTSGPRWMALPAVQDVASTSAQDEQEAASAPSEPLRGSGLPVVLEHCPFCLLMADRWAPPSQPSTLFLAVPGHAVVPVSAAPGFLPARIIAAAPPRGPPAF